MYAGIDYDTKAVHVILLSEEGVPTYAPFVMHGADAWERTRALRDVMPSRGWWGDHGVIGICIEEPMGQNTRPLNRVQGAIIACLPTSLLVKEMRPGEWRNGVGLKGNATKEDVAEFVRERLYDLAGQKGELMLDVWPQDACDAYCLALCAENLTKPVGR